MRLPLQLLMQPLPAQAMEQPMLVQLLALAQVQVQVQVPVQMRLQHRRPRRGWRCRCEPASSLHCTPCSASRTRSPQPMRLMRRRAVRRHLPVTLSLMEVRVCSNPVAMPVPLPVRMPVLTPPVCTPVMWSLFHHYASLGDPTHATKLSMAQFRRLCRDARVTARGGGGSKQHIPLANLDVMFVKASGDLPGTTRGPNSCVCALWFTHTHATGGLAGDGTSHSAAATGTTCPPPPRRPATRSWTSPAFARCCTRSPRCCTRSTSTRTRRTPRAMPRMRPWPCA